MSDQLCKHCGKAVILYGRYWIHRIGGELSCHSTTNAEPSDRPYDPINPNPSSPPTQETEPDDMGT